VHKNHKEELDGCGSKRKIKRKKKRHKAVHHWITPIGQDKLSPCYSYNVSLTSQLLCHLATISGAFVKACFGSQVLYRGLYPSHRTKYSVPFLVCLSAIIHSTSYSSFGGCFVLVSGNVLQLPNDTGEASYFFKC